MAGEVERRIEEIRSHQGELDPEAGSYDPSVAAELSSEHMLWLAVKLSEVTELLRDEALEDFTVAADELAACTNEQKLARNVRIHVESLRSILDLDEA